MLALPCSQQRQLFLTHMFSHHPVVMHPPVLFICLQSPRLGVKSFFAGMIEQYERDAFIFHNKQYKPAPLLVKEDALIGKYRKWFAQFYSGKTVNRGHRLHWFWLL